MSQQETMRQQLENSHGAMLAASEGMSADEMARILAPGLAPVIWQFGHLATAEAGIGGFAGGKFAPPKEFSELFGQGTGTGPARYPAFGQVKEAFDGANQALVKIALEADYETPLDTPLSKYFGTVGGMLTFLLYHRGWHMGKVTTLRTMLGKARLFG